ncbi:MAG: UDP-2,3-diacylglucosamine diphosphatase [Gammaproteobacteria bacterium]|nr:UDP-2,3-diacylglucosamine diphosphatase [Gammaproteobacteria bacterium]
MTPLHQIQPLKYRAIWISDVHLGYRGCKADYLLDLLRTVETDYLFLVGDIIDLWSMRKTMYWPQSHNNVVRTILGKAKHGTKVIYIPGNHDESLREFDGAVFGNLSIHTEYVHTTRDGRRVLLLHGDKFDALLSCGRGWDFIGNIGYDGLLFINRILYKLRRYCGYGYWSLAGYIKNNIRNARNHVRRFEASVAREAKHRHMDVVICGHIHHPEIRNIDGVLYCNDGDWVENCTALVEKYDGSLELIHWSDRQLALKADLYAPTADVARVA